MRKSEIHAAESVSSLNKALNQLKDIWEEIGIPEDQRLQRTDAVHMHIKNLLDMMIAEEEGLKKRLLTSIEACRNEVSSLCDELQLQEFQEEDGLTMLQLEKDLRTQVKLMLKEKSSRQTELKSLIQQDQDLCDVLCEDLFPIHPERVPSQQQLQNYRQHINTRNQEKERRHAEFVEMKRQITVLMEDLEQSPDTTFEKDAVCEDEDAFCLSVENISSLKVLLRQLETRKAESEALSVSIQARIEELWEMLEIPLEERDGLMLHTHSSTKSRLNALQAEFQRMEGLKKKNIERVIRTIRSEIVKFWEKCYFSQEQRRAFLPFHSDDLDDDLLREHEQELERLKQNYTEYKELYDAVSTWSSNWTLYQELEKKATDPSRFNNRGGNLLKEEKQRVDLQKSLPKLEKSLKAQIDQWEAAQCKEFRVNGQQFLQYVEEQWSHHRMQKEMEKQERQMKKIKQTEEDLLYGTVIRTPTKRRIAGTPTPGKTRKLTSASSMCSSTPNTTLRSICSSPSMRPPLSSSKLNARTPARGRTPRGLERNKENLSHLSGALRTMTASPHSNYSITSVASSYSEFAKDSESTAASSGSSRTLLNPQSRLDF
ncbi:protein regulator of cytokinesis 1a [Danio rerio]|uniref:Protein regulator of cytokinesis 1 n=1 Tax=Danio rerio TaxID=7955 RepID=Q6DI02_DANRE|nr:protein regulator of cytokinesis 1a [Danio rerio]AAH75789.1 Protein regulator of cytokinesis 1 [Danio rerio]|eukprot:NP_001004494.1 protein regulator of cytokinesis 1a [Danio rerio]